MSFNFTFSNPPEGGFSFGRDSQKDSTKQEAGGGISFGFGTQLATTESAKTDSGISSLGGFTFGTDTKTGETTKVSDSKETNALSGFSFGSVDTKKGAEESVGKTFSFGETKTNSAPKDSGLKLSFDTTAKSPSPQGSFQTTTQPPSTDQTPNITLSTTKESGNGILKSQTKKTQDSKQTVRIETPSATKMKTDTVEMIIKNWNNELSEDIIDFKKYADQVSKWDRELLENEEKVNFTFI